MFVAVEAMRVVMLAENRLPCEARARILNKKNDRRVVGASALATDAVHQVAGDAPDGSLSDSTAVLLSNLRLVPEMHAAIHGQTVVMIGREAEEDKFLRAVRDEVVGSWADATHEQCEVLRACRRGRVA